MAIQLSDRNVKLFTDYALGKDLDLKNMDHDMLVENFENLFLAYATDNNSSTIRELVTLCFLGYTSYSDKHGADGIDPLTGIEIEVKPKNLADFDKDGKPVKHAGGGNFNDMNEHLMEQKRNYDVVCSGFNEGRLVYVVQFHYIDIWDQLNKHILKAVAGEAGKRVVCSFNHNHYDVDHLKVHYVHPELSKRLLNGPHLKLIKKHNGKSQ